MARVFVGMSGGVDSSVAAALLKDQGHHVVGVYMKNWSQDLPGMRCPWAEDLADAKRVAVGLGIDFQVFDFEKEYREKVVQYMIDEYEAGRTPNPDIMCNQEVKFKLFLEAALEQGAEMIATGHYAKVEREELAQGARLMRAVDSEKDQTYFLYRVTAEALTKTLFPLGEYTKQQVREIAKEKGLFTAHKKESMGVCFVGEVGMREFLNQFVEAFPGDIIDKQTGKTLGRHDGALFYTLGQRHGLDIGGGLPYYVVGKDMQANQVFVSTNLNDAAMWPNELSLGSVHWIHNPPQSHENLTVRLRHRGELLPVANLAMGSDTTMLSLDKPERAVASGQSAVIYRGDEVLGGGIVV